jgi:hypothetical protein
MIGRLQAFLAVGLALFATAAHAIDPLGDPAQFQRDVEEINRKPLPDGEPLARAVGSAVAIDVKMRGRCQPTKISLGKLEPVTLDGMVMAMIVNGQIENGWLVSVTLADCPPADPTRVLLLRTPDNQLKGIFAGQGETLAWPTLSREALRSTVSATAEKLRSADPQCQPRDLTPVSVKVTDTSADLSPSQYGLRLKGSWSELWVFEPCGHKVRVPIAFRTNGAGGAYWDVDPDKVEFEK